MLRNFRLAAGVNWLGDLCQWQNLRPGSWHTKLLLHSCATNAGVGLKVVCSARTEGWLFTAADFFPSSPTTIGNTNVSGSFVVSRKLLNFVLSTFFLR